MYAQENAVCLCVCVFISVVLMLSLTWNPSLSPAMRLQPAMGNADYCCYSIRQSAFVCVRACMCVFVRERTRERVENRYYTQPGAKCFSVTLFVVQDHFLACHTSPCHSEPMIHSVPQRSEITECCIATDWFHRCHIPSHSTLILLVSPVLALQANTFGGRACFWQFP